MKLNLGLIITVLPMLVGVALFAGCSKESEKDGHAGHSHSEMAGAHDGHGQESGGEAKTNGNVKMCPEHNVPADECGICKPQLIGQLKTGESLKVRLASGESTLIGGIRTAQPTLGTISEGVDCYAELSFNQNKYAQVTAPVGGLIQEVGVDLGSKVVEKQTIARVWSATIAENVAKAVLSHQTLERERKLRKEKITSEKDLQLAEAEHRAACQQLRTLGFTEEQIDEIGAKPQDQVLMDIRAPFDGEVVERVAVRGSMVEAGRTLFTVADRSMMWAMLNIPEASLANVHVGQTVELQVDALPGRVFLGKLTWIGAEVDERSRMARGRAEITNADNLLKARMFAHARIFTHTSDGALIIPSSAIQHIEGKNFVFVKNGEDLFDARVVHTGCKESDRVEIVEGLNKQEAVVVDHGFSLKSALLISRLGAGCADD